MFYIETVYLQMAANRELAKERLRGQVELDDRPKADSAQARVLDRIYAKLAEYQFHVVG